MISKFKLYEAAVQSPEWQVDYLPQFHKFLTGKPLKSLREDFCGTGKISCEWVKRSKSHTAVGLDLDTEVLDYANAINKAELSKEQQSRVQFLKQDVLKPTREKFDSVGAYNFSFFIFHERKTLKKYAQSVYKSLKSKGTFFMELSGGPGFVETDRETRKVKIPGFGKFEVCWEQFHYDPITAVSDYSIHFKLPNGKWLNDAFTYNWRVWQIREVQDILEEVGFKKSIILWEQLDKKGSGNGEFLPTEIGEHLHTWVAYIVGVKSV